MTQTEIAFTGLAVAFGVQAVGIVWWAATQTASTKMLEKRADQCDAENVKREASDTVVATTLARLDERLRAVQTSLGRVERQTKGD